MACRSDCQPHRLEVTMEQSTAAAPFVTCENLVKIYKIADLEVVALQGLDMMDPQGRSAGYCRLQRQRQEHALNILGGLDRPTAGKVSVDGVDLLKLSASGLTATAATRSASSGSRCRAT